MMDRSPKWGIYHNKSLEHIYDSQLQSKQACMDCWRWLGCLSMCGHIDDGKIKYTTTESDFRERKEHQINNNQGLEATNMGEEKKRLLPRTFFAGDIAWLPRSADQLGVKGRQPQVPDPEEY